MPALGAPSPALGVPVSQPPSRHVLITGGAGFIGSHLGAALLDRGDRVTALDAFAFGYDPALKEANAARLEGRPGFQLVRGDIRDRGLLDRIMAADRPEVVVHLAARAGVRTSLGEPESYAEVNVGGTMTVLEAMRAAGVSRLVFASSSSVYGARRDPPFRETDDVSVPASPYAATKRAGELLCATWHHLYGIESTCLRFFTVYGPHQRPDMAICKFTRALLQGAPLPLFGDGRSSRDYTFVTDIVRGVLAAVDRPLGHTIVNLGNHSPVTLAELVDKLAAAVGTTPRIERLPDQPGDVPTTCADISRAQELLGYRPEVSLDEGLARVVAWMRAADGSPPAP